MKNFSIIILLVLIISCNSKVEKPKNLIDKNKMEDILYDMSLMESIKNQGLGGGVNGKEMFEFLQKKYNVDSIQYVESNKYYALDIDGYKKMLENVKVKLETESKKYEVKGENPTEDLNLDSPRVE